MKEGRVYLIIICIFILAFLAGNLSEPKYLNQGIDFLNLKFKILNLKFVLPHFWEKPFKLGLDLQGGSHLVYEADLSQIEEKEKGNAMQGLRDVIERRVNYFGVQEPVVQVQGQRLIIELAGVVDRAEAIKEIGKTPILEFKELKSDDIVKKIEEKRKEAVGKTTEEIQQIPDWQLAFEDTFQSTSLTGKYLQKAQFVLDQTTYKPIISLQFNDEGAKLFGEITGRNVNKPLAVYLDNQLTQAPVVKEKITGGKAQITGDFTVDEARKRVQELNAGALPVPIKLISQQSVGPILGKLSLEQSLKAGIFGFLAVILFMLIFYRLPGLISALALGIYIALVLAIIKLSALTPWSITLTLAGIGGFILSIGMAVDANILIFSRMREELKEKKDFNIALTEGIRRAWPSIRDSNFNTLLVSSILFAFGTSFVRGFALTLILGVLVSMFSAIFITNNFLKVFINTRFAKIKWLW